MRTEKGGGEGQDTTMYVHPTTATTAERKMSVPCTISPTSLALFPAARVDIFF